MPALNACAIEPACLGNAFLKAPAAQEDAGTIRLCLSSARVAELASRAAILEAAAGSKPGLVCIGSNGAHNDMSYPLFVRSASALQEYFARAHALGKILRAAAPEWVFPPLRRLGIEAEARMSAATHGVNTHKGLIFSLGLFCAATGRLMGQQAGIAEICRTASSFVQGLTIRDFATLARHRETLSQAGLFHSRAGTLSPKAARPILEKHLGRPLSAGETLYLLHGVTGIRGEAEDGFPHVNLAWQHLTKNHAADDLNAAMVHSLLELIRSLRDTTLLWRGGLQGLAHAGRSAKAVLMAGGMRTPVGRTLLRHMAADFNRRGLSPGGCADVLAVSVFLFLLRRHADFPEHMSCEPDGLPQL